MMMLRHNSALSSTFLCNAKGDFHQKYLPEHADGRLSTFLKKDLIKIRPINNSSLCGAVPPRTLPTLSSRKTQTNTSPRRFLILFKPQAQSTVHPFAQSLSA
jgi:hypothetical protein